MDRKPLSAVRNDFDFVLKDMDDLDKQLAELQLINNTELPPNPTLQRPGTASRKIAPVVPPKPKKPQPQVRKVLLLSLLIVSAVGEVLLLLYYTAFAKNTFLLHIPNYTGPYDFSFLVIEIIL